MKHCGMFLALALTPLAAFGEVRYDEAEVVDVEPIVEVVERIEPSERCWTETALVPAHAESATTPLIGALIGGAIGNAVGHNKTNKKVGAVIGAVLGASIAQDVASERPARRARRAAHQDVCETQEKVRRVERVTGYMVTYRHDGQIHRARMSKRPGDTIRVRVRVEPA